MNMYIWVIGTLNQLFISGSYAQITFNKNEVVTGKTPFLVICKFSLK